MGTIIKRGQRYLARVRLTDFPAVSKSFIRRADAARWLTTTEADMQAGRWQGGPEVEAPSLAGAIQEYREKVAVKLKGARDYGYAFRELENSPLADERLDRIKPAHLADWRDQLLARGLVPATVARRLGLLSAVLGWAHRERGYLDSNPMKAVKKPVVRDARTRTLDDDEVRYLSIATASARARWLDPAVTLLCEAAFRRSELVNLLCEDVNLAQGVALLRDTKNGSARMVPLAPRAREAMRGLLTDATEAKRATVLPISDPEAMSFAFKRAVLRARARYEEDCLQQGLDCDPKKLTGIRLHDLRHHSISVWARAGLSLGELMLVSGHKSPRMVARYLHMNPAQVAQRMASIGAAPPSASAEPMQSAA